MLRTIRLYGELGKKYGRVHKAHVSCVAEAIRYFTANFPDFRDHLTKRDSAGVGYEVWDGELALEEDNKDLFYKEGSKDIKIIPRVVGSGAAGRIVAGVVLLIVGYFFPILAPYTTPLGIALIAGGIAELMSPKPHYDEGDLKVTDANSYIFSGPLNNTRQGNPVPVGYGEMIIGSQVISAAITVNDIPV